MIQLKLRSLPTIPDNIGESHTRLDATRESLLTVTSTPSLIKLRNNLQALLISDPATDKAAAALGVQVGHLSDPDDLPGLAHFCEHSTCARPTTLLVPERRR